MTIRQIIAELQRMGYNVQYIERFERLSKKQMKAYIKKDPEKAEYYTTTKFARGIRITAIDGTKFTGSAGNITARQMLGEALSVKREKQLEKIRKPRVERLSNTVDKALRRVQRLANKLRKKQTEEERLDPKKSIPKITRKNIRYTVQHGGEQAALIQLEDYERRIRKLVPTWLWHDFVERVDSNDSFFIALANEGGAEEFIEKWKEFVSLVHTANIDKIKYYDDYEPLVESLYVIMSDYAGVDFIAGGTATVDGMITIARRIQ